MRTVVDRTTVAMGVEVCSFYLLDRDGETLTLAATNGLDREQVGSVSLAMGQGITGRAAAERTPVTSRDVTTDERFSWVRGFDIAGLRAMLSMPLVWDEQVVGVLNVQTTDARDFAPEEIEFLATIAALLAGIVEKGRMQAEAEAQLDRLSQLDAARAELLAVVTHELRTPLAVVRAYVDLLADAAGANAAEADAAGRRDRTLVDVIENWRAGATDQVTRLDRLVDSILASVRGEGLTGLRREPFDVVFAIDKTVGTLALLLRTRAVRWTPPAHALVARGDEARFRQVLEHLLDNEAKYAPPEQAVSHRRVADRRRDPGLHHRRRPGRPDRGLGGRVPAVRARGPGAVAGLGHRAVRGAAPDGGDGRPRLDREERVRRIALHGGAADRLIGPNRPSRCRRAQLPIVTAPVQPPRPGGPIA